MEGKIGKKYFSPRIVNVPGKIFLEKKIPGEKFPEPKISYMVHSELHSLFFREKEFGEEGK